MSDICILDFCQISRICATHVNICTTKTTLKRDKAAISPIVTVVTISIYAEFHAVQTTV
uniref:Uncharacterized protein n=1 Tax=Siphoviridae sp. ctoyo6 TaxID=2825674 RepID=A0A8S5U375_9CAUD|nr:MAG TPA: hypothetical protein [Siphoviridae sp. ctoyo6]